MPEITSRLSTALADRYKIERHLGAGGMATVYLAHDLKHDRKVAVKVLRPELAAVLGAERFVQEIKTTANLQHPHILPLFDSGEADSFLYYVMPFIDGETLRDKLNRETQLGIDEAVGITTAIADALDYAHRHNVIHRDIKPENILLHDGHPMVVDFGIALALSAAAGGRMTETGISLGTPHYMSPEQATAEKNLTNRSDIYSLGAVLYEMLTGEPPHTGASAQAIIMKIVTDEARPVTELRKSVPPNVAGATAKALEKLPADRFGSAREFVDALANASFSLSGLVPAGRMESRTKLERFGWPVLAALVAALATWASVRSPPTPLQVSRLLALAETDRLEGQPAITPDGTAIVYVARNIEGRGRGGGTALAQLGAQLRLYLRPMNELDAVPIGGTEGAQQPVISNDGRWVAFVKGGVVYRVAVSGSPATDLATVSGQTRGLAWLSSDTVIVSSERGLLAVPVAGGSVALLATPDTASGVIQYRWPQVLDDGSILVTLWRGDLEAAQVGLLRPGTRQAITVIPRGTYGRYTSSKHLVYARPDGSLHAVPFDLSRSAALGASSPVLDGVRVGSNGEADFSISQSGTLVYATAVSEERQLVLVNRNGQKTIVSEQQRLFDEPRFAPSGDEIAVSIRDGGSRDIWLLDLRQQILTRFTHGRDDRYPQWSPDGRRIAFSSYRNGPSSVFLRSTDGGGQARVLGRSAFSRFPTSWTRDGGILIQEIQPIARRNVLVLRVDDPSENPIDYLSDSWEEFSAEMSPDGRWVAYVSNESGQLEVYVRRFPGARAKVQVSTNGATEPRWSPLGDELYYRTVDNQFVAARVRLQPTFSVVSRTELFADHFVRRDWMASYDVHPNGDGFLFSETVEDSEPHPVMGDRGLSELVVVTNWLEELKAKVGNQ